MKKKNLLGYYEIKLKNKKMGHIYPSTYIHI